LARFPNVDPGEVDGQKASFDRVVAALADAWAADQTLAAVAHGFRARPRARCRLRLEGDLPDSPPALELLLHHAPVPALLGPRDRVRDLRGRPAVGQLPEAHPVGARTVSPWQLDEQRGRGDPRLSPARARTAHPRHRPP